MYYNFSDTFSWYPIYLKRACHLSVVLFETWCATVLLEELLLKEKVDHQVQSAFAGYHHSFHDLSRHSSAFK